MKQSWRAATSISEVQVRPVKGDGMAVGRHERWGCDCASDAICPARTVGMRTAVQIGATAEEIWSLSETRPLPPGMRRPDRELAAHVEELRGTARRRWRWPGEAEQRTDVALQAVQPAGFLVLRDLIVPGTPVRIHHLVVGATGIWALESQRWSFRRAIEVHRCQRHAMAARNGQPWSAPYDPTWHPPWLRAAAATACSAAHAVAEATRAPRPRIRPLLCVHGQVPHPGLLVDGVPVVAANRLLAVLMRGPLLSSQELTDCTANVLSVVRPACKAG